MGVIQYLSVFVFALTIVLSIVVLAHNPKNRVNQIFGLILFAFALWVFTNVMVDVAKTEPQLLLWGRLTIASPLFIPPLLVYFFSIFPSSNKKTKRIEVIIAGILMAVALAFIFFINTNLNIKSAKFINHEPGFELGILYLILIISAITATLTCIASSIFKLKVLSPKDKNKLKTIVLGINIAIIIGILTNILSVWININSLSGIGPALTLAVFFLTAYLILKDTQFNISIFSAEIFIIIIIILLSFEIPLNINAENQWINIIGIIAYFLVITISYLLIRNLVLENERKRQAQKLADQLESANRELKKLSELKDDFFRLAAHEINTPMTSILGYLSMILDEGIGSVDEKAEGYLKKVYFSSKRLTNVVTGFLDTIKMEAGKVKLELEETDICALIKEVTDEYEEKIKEKNNSLIFEKISLSKDGTIKIKADKSKLKEVFINIIDNAIKFTSDGYIKIACQEKERELRISMEDSGHGIGEEDLKHVFDKFYQARDSGPKQNSGTGLGLYIAKVIIEMHGGTITASSEMGKGTKFSMVLQKIF